MGRRANKTHWRPAHTPAGDFLLSLDLQDGGDSGGPAAASGVGVGGDDVFAAASGSGGASKDSQRQRQQQQQPTLLDLSLRLLEHAAAASPAAAALLYRRDLFALCDELCTYCTPAVVAAGQRLFAAVADRVAAAAEEVVQGGMPPSLAALLLHSGSADRRVAALGKLAAVADTCSGDDFALLCGVLPGQGGGGGGGRAAAEAALLCQACSKSHRGSKAAPALTRRRGRHKLWGLPWSGASCCCTEQRPAARRRQRSHQHLQERQRHDRGAASRGGRRAGAAGSRQQRRRCAPVAAAGGRPPAGGACTCGSRCGRGGATQHSDRRGVGRGGGGVRVWGQLRG